MFEELQRRFDRALEQRRSVVLDSTGMSHRFRALLRAHRERIVHVHLLLHDLRSFEARERGRTDRSAGMLTAAAFHRSQRVEFHREPDLAIATDDLTAEQVYEIVISAVRTSHCR